MSRNLMTERMSMSNTHRRRAPSMISRPGAHLGQIPHSVDAEVDLKSVLQLLGRCITLQEEILACDSYAQPGMRARVSKMRACGLDGAIAVTLDFGEFETFNKPFETTSWEDQHLIVQLTAREAGAYAQVEDYFLAGVQQVRRAMSPLNEKVSSALQARFRESGRPEEDYIAWLEERLAAVSPDLIENNLEQPLDLM
ncbi:hypothetical protein KUV57_12820 [Epibacterium sp. DP7N7-1]|nr:hypothetical protein [Epibacterium sp. DP7N7-1]